MLEMIAYPLAVMAYNAAVAVLVAGALREPGAFGPVFVGLCAIGALR
jgi:hypothetical protein